MVDGEAFEDAECDLAVAAGTEAGGVAEWCGAGGEGGGDPSEVSLDE